MMRWHCWRRRRTVSEAAVVQSVTWSNYLHRQAVQPRAHLGSANSISTSTDDMSEIFTECLAYCVLSRLSSLQSSLSSCLIQHVSCNTIKIIDWLIQKINNLKIKSASLYRVRTVSDNVCIIWSNLRLNPNSIRSLNFHISDAWWKNRFSLQIDNSYVMKFCFDKSWIFAHFKCSLILQVKIQLVENKLGLSFSKKIKINIKENVRKYNINTLHNSLTPWGKQSHIKLTSRRRHEWLVN